MVVRSRLINIATCKERISARGPICTDVRMHRECSAHRITANDGDLDVRMVKETKKKGKFVNNSR